MAPRVVVGTLFAEKLFYILGGLVIHHIHLWLVSFMLDSGKCGDCVERS